jgi:hypothetical protein
MRCCNGRLLALLASLISVPLPAQAQTRAIFAGGSVIADDDRTNSALTEHVATSWSLVAGLDFMKHLGIRFTFDMPRQSDFVTENIFTRPPELPAREKLTRTRRTMTYALLADVHMQVARRMRLAVPFGLSTVTHDSETTVVREELRPDGTTSPLPDLHDGSHFPWTGLQIGVEVPLLLTDRLEIVPELRTIYFPFSDSPQPYIIRPGVGIRWRF